MSIKVLLYLAISIMLVNSSGCSSTKTDNKAFTLFNEGVSLSLDAEDQAEMGNVEKANELNIKAIEKFQQTLSIDPTHSSATSATGHSYYMNRNFDQAIVWFEKALELDSNSVASYMEYGLSKINLGNIPEGKAALDKAISLDTNNRETREFAVYSVKDIGNLAYEYGVGYDSQGEVEKGLEYKKFALGVMYAAYKLDSSRQDVIKRVVELAEEVDEQEVVEAFRKRIK